MVGGMQSQRKVTYGEPGKHPRVSITPLTCTRHKVGRCWEVRWRELDEHAERKRRVAKGTPGRARSKSVHEQSESEAVKYATRVSLRITAARARDDARRFKAEKLGLDPNAPAAKRYRIDDACRAYYLTLFEAAAASPSTLIGADRGLLCFIGWMRDRGVHYLDELTVDLMREWYRYLRTRPMTRPERDTSGCTVHASRPHRRARMPSPACACRVVRATYKVSSVNQILKPVRTMLRVELALSHVPNLTDANLRIVIPHVPVFTAADRKKHGVESSCALTPNQIRALLAAAVRRDRDYMAAGWPEPPCASDIALLLLCGWRRDEYTGAKCGAVGRDAEYGWHVHIHGKGRRERDVGMLRFSKVGAELLRAQHGGRPDGQWLSCQTYRTIAHVLLELHAVYDAPAVTSHDLRATCASYQTALRNVTPQDMVDRLGHLLTENQQTYVQKIKGIKRPAASLEDAMRATKEFRAVLSLMRSYPKEERPSVLAATGISTRLHGAAKNAHALASKDHHELERALAKRVA